MSKTPRTDADSFLINDGKREVVGVEVSRKLECELAESSIECERLKSYGTLPAFLRMTDWKSRAEKAEAECERLRRENDALLEKINEDANAVRESLAWKTRAINAEREQGVLRKIVDTMKAEARKDEEEIIRLTRINAELHRTLDQLSTQLNKQKTMLCFTRKKLSA